MYLQLEKDELKEEEFRNKLIKGNYPSCRKRGGIGRLWNCNGRRGRGGSLNNSRGKHGNGGKNKHDKMIYELFGYRENSEEVQKRLQEELMEELEDEDMHRGPGDNNQNDDEGWQGQPDNFD
jgi:hypothetical protein